MSLAVPQSTLPSLPTGIVTPRPGDVADIDLGDGTAIDFGDDAVGFGDDTINFGDDTAIGGGSGSVIDFPVDDTQQSGSDEFGWASSMASAAPDPAMSISVIAEATKASNITMKSTKFPTPPTPTAAVSPKSSATGTSAGNRGTYSISGSFVVIVAGLAVIGML